MNEQPLLATPKVDESYGMDQEDVKPDPHFAVPHLDPRTELEMEIKPTTERIVEVQSNEATLEQEGGRELSLGSSASVELVLGAEDDDDEPGQPCSITRETAPALSTPRSYPAVLLPQPGDVFASPEAFVAACTAGLQAERGLKMWTGRVSDTVILATCSRRNTLRCRMHIGAKLGAGGWTILASRSNYEHHHEIAAARAAGPAPSKRTRMPATSPDATSWELGDDVAVEASDESGDSSPESDSPDQANAYREAFPGLPPSIPNLPRVGDRFPSVDALCYHLRILTVPIIGVNFRKISHSVNKSRLVCNNSTSKWQRDCSFSIIAEEREDGGYVLEGSCFEHSHGRDKRIIKDPTWRPNVRGNTPYRAAADRLRLEEINREDQASRASSSAVVRTPLSPFDGQRVRKRIKSIASTPSDPLSRPPSSSLTVAERKPRLFSPRPFGSSSTTTSATSPRALLHHQATSQLFLPQLAFFLASLHPSLSSSADMLFEAGIKNLSLLVAFVGLSDRARDGFLQQSKLPLLRRHLLIKKLKEASSAGRTSRG